MEDGEIIELYWNRSEQAIAESAAKYGRYCGRIAYNILTDREDAEETVNDTWLQAWNAIPPNRPAVLQAFLGRITRLLALKKHRYNTADKRGGSETNLAFDELAECLPTAERVEEELIAAELRAAVDHFLSMLSREARQMFVLRYWYIEPIAEIAVRFSCGESRVRVTLLRTRRKLRTYLEKEGLV